MAEKVPLPDESVLQNEAEQLLLWSLKRHSSGIPWTRFKLLTELAEPFPAGAEEELIKKAQARVLGHPLQHLTGSQVFVDHEYQVSPEVLIPRPETETLFVTARDILQEISVPLYGVEVGLGSGILSIELLAHFSSLRMIATEISESARHLASQNAQHLLGEGMDRLNVLAVRTPSEVLESVILQLAGQRVDFVISNPPYLASPTEAEVDVVQFEPHQALFAPQGDPNYFYRILATQAKKVLKPHGFLFLEIPHERAQSIGELFKINLGWDSKILPDLTGRERVVVAQLLKSSD